MLTGWVTTVGLVVLVMNTIGLVEEVPISLTDVVPAAFTVVVGVTTSAPVVLRATGTVKGVCAQPTAVIP